MKPFQLIRTNPLLTGNVKLVVSENYELFLESYDSSRNLKQSKYKHYSIHHDEYWKEVLPKFFNKTDISDIFVVKNSDIYNSVTDLADQYDDIYFSGAKNVEDKFYQESMEYTAPLHIKNTIPEAFYIFAIPGMGSTDFNDFKSNMNCVKTFDLINSDLGIFLNNIVSDNTKPKHPLVMDTSGYGLSYISGINLNTSGYINSYFDNSFTQDNMPIFRMEEYVSNLFKTNNTIYPDIINMKFLFNDIPSSPTSINEYTMNRYIGMYVNSKKLNKNITPYESLPVKTVVVYDTVEQSFINSENVPVSPFDIVWDDNTKYYVYVKYKKNNEDTINYFRVIRNVVSNTFKYTIVNFDGDVVTDNKLTNEAFQEKQVTITINGDLGNLITNLSMEYNPMRVYTIEILGVEYSLQYVNNNYYVKSYNKIDVDKHNIVLTNNNIVTTTPISDYISFNIYYLEFADQKDFDFDRESTNQAKFEYDKTNELVFNDEPKFFAKNLTPTNINVYALSGTEFKRLPRVDTNNNPLYLQDLLGTNNPVTNLPYTQYELYSNDNGNFMLYHDGVNFYDYNLKLLALEQPFVRENGYIFEVVVDSVVYRIEFNDNTSVYQTADWGVDGKDLVSTSLITLPDISISTPNVDKSYIPASSEYITSCEAYEINNNELTSFYDKNQSVVKWGATGSLDIHNYPYRLNYSTDFPVYNSVIPMSSDIYTRTDMCFDYFYRINNPSNYLYSFTSLHLNISGFDKSTYVFDDVFSNVYYNDKGKYNYRSYSVFTIKNNSSFAETIFRGLKIGVEAKYDGYRFSIIFATDASSDDLKSGINIIVDDNDKSIVMHLYINSSSAVNINSTDIETCVISEWYNDIYLHDDKNTTTEYLNTGFYVNGKYINVRPQDFALPNIIKRIINEEYTTFDKTKEFKVSEKIVLNVSYPDMLTVRKDYNIKILDTPTIEVTNTYDNINKNGVMNTMDFYHNDFLSVELTQTDDRNLWELGESDKTIYRYSAGYSPIFKNIEMFLYKDNSIFDNTVYDFGVTSELYISKANIYGAILKIDDTTSDKSMYPKIDEYGLFVTRKNILSSNVEQGTFIMNRKMVKDLTNTNKSGNDVYFNNSSITIPDSEIFSNENSLITQTDYTLYTEESSFNNTKINIPFGLTGYTFITKLLKNTEYTFLLTGTTPNLDNISFNVPSGVTITKIVNNNSYKIKYIDAIYPELTVDVSCTLSNLPTNPVSVGIFIGELHESYGFVVIPNNSSEMYVESSDYLTHPSLDEPYMFQTYDTLHNNFYSNRTNVVEYNFPIDSVHTEYISNEPGRFGGEPYDTDYIIPDSWDADVYYKILNDYLGENCGDKLKEKITPIGGGSGVYTSSSVNLSTIYHFLEYGSQPEDKNNFDADDYRTYRVGYIVGLTYFYTISGMNTNASTLNTKSYKNFSLNISGNTILPTQNVLANTYATKTITNNYILSLITGPEVNSVELVWDLFYNDTTLSFDIQNNDGSNNVGVSINLYNVDSYGVNTTKKTYTEIGNELDAVLNGKYNVVIPSGFSTDVSSINVPRVIYIIKSLNPYYTEQFNIVLSTINDFRTKNQINIKPTVSINEIAKKNILKTNRVTGRTNEVTVEFFVKTNSFNKSFETIFYKGNSSDISYFIGRDDRSNRLMFRTNHEVFFDKTKDNINNYRLNNKSYTTHDLFSNNFINDGKYHHVACVADYYNRTKSIYIDGRLDISVTDYLDSHVPDISIRLACFIANTPRFVGSNTQHINIENIYTLAYAIMDIDNLDQVTKKYAEYWKNGILGNIDFNYTDLMFMKNNWMITYTDAFKIFNDNFASLNYSIKTDIGKTFDLNIGNSPASYTNFFTGNLDQIRVWNYARTSDDIYKNYRYNLSNTYSEYSKSLLVNMNFNNNITNNAVVSRDVYSWFVSRNEKIFKTPVEYGTNDYDAYSKSFVRYDFTTENYLDVDISSNNVALTVSDANIIGQRDEKANIAEVLDNTVITNYKNYYTNSLSNPIVTTISEEVNPKLIYKI
jgi:hypothetical protein